MAPVALHHAEQPTVYTIDDALGEFQQWLDTSEALTEVVNDGYHDLIESIERAQIAQFDEILRHYGLPASTANAFALCHMLRASASTAQDLVAEYVSADE